MLVGVQAAGPKAKLHRYLQTAPEVVFWELERLSVYDALRPLTPTGTNRLGLVARGACVVAGG